MYRKSNIKRRFLKISYKYYQIKILITPMQNNILFKYELFDTKIIFFLLHLKYIVKFSYRVAESSVSCYNFDIF